MIIVTVKDIADLIVLICIVIVLIVCFGFRLIISAIDRINNRKNEVENDN